MAAPNDSPEFEVVDGGTRDAQAPVDPAPGDGVRPGATVPAAPADRPGGGRRPWIWFAALGVALIWAFIASQRAARLEGEVTRLSGELAATSAALEAHRDHLDRVRDGVDDLRGQVEALSSLAHGEPGAEPAEPSATGPSPAETAATEMAATETAPGDAPAAAEGEAVVPARTGPETAEVEF